MIAMIALSLMPFLVVLISAIRWGSGGSFSSWTYNSCITVVGGGAGTILMA
jgi:hypothetical protein